LETVSIARPIGPNQITKTMEIVFESDYVGKLLYTEIDQVANTHPAYRNAVLSAMNCFNMQLGCVETDPLSYCDGCQFGPEQGNTRTLCTQYLPQEAEPNIQYAVLPSSDYSRDRQHAVGLGMSIPRSVEVLEKANYITIPRSHIAKAKRTGGLGFETSLQARSENAVELEKIVLEAGIKIPKYYNINNLGLTGDIAVVAKNTGEHRGNQKYLLSSMDQKSRYAAGLYLYANARSIFNFSVSRNEILDSLKDVMMDASSGGIELAGLFDKIVIQEYIASPQDRASSLRVQVSGYGEIMYAEALIAPQKNIERPLTSLAQQVKDYENSQDSLKDFRKLIRNNQDYNFELFEALFFTNPKSPLFLNTVDIVSNWAKGSVIVPLNGKVVGDRDLAEQLDLMGLDPNKPVLPDSIAKVSSQIGIASRFIWPHSGIDFIPDTQGEFYYLETNLPAGLNRDLIEGANSNMDSLALDNLLLTNIARSRKR
jgi:hypothetical protein